MPLLMLMRHGKSNWDGSWTTDHERPLARRGIKAAARIGRFLTATDHQPAVVLSSTAIRAVETAQYATDAGQWNCSMVLEPTLYGGGPEVVMEIVRKISPGIECALMIGHNPSWTDTTSILVGGSNLHLPTAAIACLDIQGSWESAGPGRADLLWLITPRLLKESS